MAIWDKVASLRCKRWLARLEEKNHFVVEHAFYTAAAFQWAKDYGERSVRERDARTRLL